MTAVPAFDPSILDQLACPACLGGLGWVAQRLLCNACGRTYPIVEGIPVLIAGREEPAPLLSILPRSGALRLGRNKISS